jgi:hypothetical protein
LAETEEGEIVGGESASAFGEIVEEPFGAPPGIDADATAPRRPDPGPAPSRPSHPGRYQNAVDELDVTTKSTQVDRLPDAATADAIATKTTINGSTQPGLNASAFGAMQRGWKVGDVSWKVKTGKKSSTVNLKAAFDITCTWGTNNGGRTDVPSADAPAVTGDNYKDVAADLTPAPVEKSWVAPRKAFWSQKLCERHEKYHAKDFRGWSSKQGKSFVTNYLNGKTVNLTDDDRKDPNAIKAKMDPIVQDGLNALSQAGNEYMRGTGNTYYSYPGEERAFGDGKEPYLALAKAVTKRGQNLEKVAKAAAEKAEKDKKKAEAKGSK